VHDVVPFGEGGWVVAAALAHDRVEPFGDEVCLGEQPANARAILTVGVFLVKLLCFVEDDA
jgi:hypothetical protein